MNTPRALALVAALAWAAPLAAADPAPPGWARSLGLSLVATSGNSSTSNLGLNLAVTRAPAPWGVEIAVDYVRAEDGSQTKAERLFGKVRATRALTGTLDAFAGLSGERDRFAGIDQRIIAELGVALKVLSGDAQELAVDAGLTRTREERRGAGTRSNWGAVGGVTYRLALSPTATLTERALAYPDLDRTSNWRLTSDTGLEAKAAAGLALKLGFLVRHSNLPVPGFKKTDTTTSASVVAKF